jgi:hypothetical protein
VEVLGAIAQALRLLLELIIREAVEAEAVAHPVRLAEAELLLFATQTHTPTPQA